MNLEHFFTPYEAVSSLPGDTVAVLAPHADDEVFGCGGALSLLARRGARIEVVVVSGAQSDAAQAL